MEDGILEAQCFKILAYNQSLGFRNFYIIPKKVSLSELLAEVIAIVMVNANAHSPLWYSNMAEDNRGASEGAKITDSDFTPLSDNTETRLPFGN